MKEGSKSRNNRRRFTLILATATVVALLIGLAISNLAGQENTSSPQVHRLNRSLSIGEITVNLSEIHEGSDTLKLHHSYSSDLPDSSFLQLDRTEVWTTNRKLGRSRSETNSGLATMSVMDWDSSRLTQGQEVTVNAGSFIVNNSSISGNATISLGSDFSKSVVSSDEVVRVSLDATLSVTGRSYKITDMTIIRKDGLQPEFHIKLEPSNAQAKLTELVSFGDSSEVSLMDDTGVSYELMRVRTRWNSARADKAVVWQQLAFAGTPSNAATEMTIRVQGGADLVGPFVFQNIRLN